jgi:hypothetical protein
MQIRHRGAILMLHRHDLEIGFPGQIIVKHHKNQASQKSGITGINGMHQGLPYQATP